MSSAASLPPLILASTSPYRRELLARLGLDFSVVAPGLPEDRLAAESPADRALRLATGKAHAVASRQPGALVIGGDQVAAAGDEILDKPGDAARCRAQLTALSGHSARFYTACVLIGGNPAVHLAHVDTTTVVFRTLARDEIARYVERDRPLDCAGGFRVEAGGIALLECVESQDPTALIGLPLIWLTGALRRAGYRLP
ncbi:MAG TPA: nucleoside triphosphate pyrophosphatase [Steroidobacteraceae bacterium]|nr:nucleoside triphosphate pyrophosphatase [Steroidobacteraceae bacterium]